MEYFPRQYESDDTPDELKEIEAYKRDFQEIIDTKIPYKEQWAMIHEGYRAAYSVVCHERGFGTPTERVEYWNTVNTTVEYKLKRDRLYGVYREGGQIELHSNDVSSFIRTMQMAIEQAQYDLEISNR